VSSYIKSGWLSLIIILQLLIFGSVAVLAADNSGGAVSPRVDVQATLDQMVKIVELYPGEENVKPRREKLREVIAPKFDFENMARSSLGTHWNTIPDVDRREFVRIFSDLLAKTYLKRIENIRSDTVRVDSERFNDPPTSAVIKTTVTYKGDKFPIDYRMAAGAGGWKVYDVIIENISLVSNYRTEFNGIIRNEQFAGLMKRLRNKITAG